MDKVQKKEPRPRGCLQLTQSFCGQNKIVYKTKTESSASALRRPKTIVVLTCYGQYYDPLFMINNISTFYADYADQVQVPEAQPYTLPNWMARTPRLYPRILYTNFRVRFITLIFCLMENSSNSGSFP